MNTIPEFALAWDEYRRRRLWFFGTWLGGFILISSLIALLSKLHVGEWAFFILGFAWMISSAAFGFRLQFFQCPRCHHRFFKHLWYYNSFARKCVHCGLPKWSVTDSQKTSSE